MNYKVISEKFITIKEENGLIENNTAGTIEIAITDSTPVQNNEENILVEPHGKYHFTKDGSKKVYVRLTNRISGLINVFETKSNDCGGSELDEYYKKTEVDEKFVKKDGAKVLSDNNYTNEDKEKLGKLNYATVAPKENGEANTGSSEKVAREDHIHPKQTTITGNAGTATKLETSRIIKLTGAVTGQANFDGSGDANITATLGNVDGSKINALTGYTKGANSNAISPSDSLLVAIGKLEKGIEEAKAPAAMSEMSAIDTKGKDFKFYYCTESEYNSMPKVKDDSTIYLVLDEKTGIVIMRCYRP